MIWSRRNKSMNARREGPVEANTHWVARAFSCHGDERRTTHRGWGKEERVNCIKGKMVKDKCVWIHWLIVNELWPFIFTIQDGRSMLMVESKGIKIYNLN